MRSRLLTSGSASVVALALGLAVGTGAAGQGPAPAPSCAMVTADEANAIFTGADLVLSENSSNYYCSFDGGFNLTISVMTESDLDEKKVAYGGGGVDVTAAGQPGYWQEGSGNLFVATNGSVVLMNGWDSAATSDAQLALLSALAELIVPRIPPGADPAVVARLRALFPPAIRDAPDAVAVSPGWYLVPVDDASTPERTVLVALLASQGRTTADLVLAFGSDGEGSAFVAEVPGLDASALLLPLLHAVAPAAAFAPVSMVEIGGEPVARIETEPPTFAFVKGDAVVYANGSDAFVASFLTP